MSTDVGLIERVDDPSSSEQKTDIPIPDVKAEDPVLLHKVEPAEMVEVVPRTSKIQFVSIFIRTYPTIIGDNPSPSLGPPLQMDWKPQEQIVLSVDEYEGNRLSERRDNFLLTGKVRTEFLIELGFSESEIDEAVQMKRQVRKNRQ